MEIGGSGTSRAVRTGTRSAAPSDSPGSTATFPRREPSRCGASGSPRRSSARLSTTRSASASEIEPMTATWDEFERLQLRVGVITEVEDFAEARDPAYKLTIDFGAALGSRRSSAKLTHYGKESLRGRQVVCVLGFEPKRIAGFKSEVLVLGAYSAEHGVVLLAPDRKIELGSEIG